jgi:hypothetical protein
MLETYSREELLPLIGYEVVAREGESVGYVDLIFADAGTNRAEWLGVWNGLPGSPRHLVPLRGIELVDGKLHVPYDDEVIKNAPTYSEEDDRGIFVGDPDVVAITPEAERAAYTHYEVEPLTPPPEGDVDVVRFRAWRIETTETRLR